MGLKVPPIWDVYATVSLANGETKSMTAETYGNNVDEAIENIDKEHDQNQLMERDNIVYIRMECRKR